MLFTDFVSCNDTVIQFTRQPHHKTGSAQSTVPGAVMRKNRGQSHKVNVMILIKK